MSEANYADINNNRVYPALSRLDAGMVAKVLVQHFSDPREATVRSEYVGNGVFGIRSARRSEAKRILRRWTSGHKSGARRVWVSTKPTTGHWKGWGRLIHDVSHIIMKYRHPSFRPHDPIHAQIEREVQVFAELTFLSK